MPQPSFDFTLVIADRTEFSEHDCNALFEAGCDDATPCSRNGRAFLCFTREAASRDDAIRSATADIEKAGMKVLEVSND